MKKSGKKVLCMLLAVLLMLPANVATVFAETVVQTQTVRLTPDRTNESGDDYFKYTAYTGKSWTNNANEAYIDLGTADSRAEECYYEIHFVGKAIEVFATKGNHGIVKFSVDGGQEETVDLYAANRTLISAYKAENLSAGSHVLKAVTQTTKSNGKIVNQVNYAVVTKDVEIELGDPYLGGTIADTNTLYTDDRFDEVKSKNVREASLTAWSNDKAISELALYASGNTVKNVSVTVSDMVGDNGEVIDASCVSAQFIRSTTAYNGGYVAPYHYPEVTETNRSESPDIIWSSEAVEIPYHTVQPVWVAFDIPKGTKPGIYTADLTVEGDDVEALTFTYRIQVLAAQLPDLEERNQLFDIELWQYPYTSAEYYGVEPFSERHLELMKSSMLLYKEIGGHAITTTISEEAWKTGGEGQTYSKNDIHYPSMIKWTKTADGFTYDYSDFDAWVSFNKELGIGDKIVLYSIAPWHNSFTYWENGQLVFEPFQAGTARYTEVWTHFLTNLIAHLEEKGWFEESFIGIDERGFSTAAFDMIDSVKNSKGVPLKTAGAMDGINNNQEKIQLARRVDDLNVGDYIAQDPTKGFAQLLADRTAAGKKTTLYSCTGHQPGNFSLSAPVESYWSIAAAGQEGTAGFLRWAYDAWVEDPLRDTTHSAYEPGDCFLIFPDEKDAENPTSRSSVRLERMAEGVRDVSKLKLMEKEYPQLASSIQAVYGCITKKGQHGGFLNDTQIEDLSMQMDAFKAGIAEVTNQYILLKNGIQVETSKTLEAGEVWKMGIGAADGVELRSADPAIASVSENGIVTAKQGGETVIWITNDAAGMKAQVSICVDRTSVMQIGRSQFPRYILDEKYQSDVEKDEANAKGRKYLGQPDMVQLDDNKTLITVFPVGHGVGKIVMKVSYDAGETWVEKTDIPSSWATSYETPTMYKLNMTDGSTKLILISGRPANFGAATGGWDSSISVDDGKTWTEYQTYCENFSDGTRNDTVVAMASLVQLKDKDGNFIDKWMGVYHDGNSFVNYKTYLTFDEKGNQQWTEPVPYLSQWRQMESSHQMCEIGMFRSPDGKRIVGLARNQSHNGPATMIYSDDEGDTWSCPVELPGSLAGERHKALYDPISGRLLITFREIDYDLNGNNQFDGGSDWFCGDWGAWVGTYEDLMSLKDGDFAICLDEDFTQTKSNPNHKSGDTGYTGMAVLPDGTFILDTYGHWDESVSSQHTGDVRQDLCWIRQAKFKLADIEAEFDAAVQSKEKLNTVVSNASAYTDMDASDYTRESWEKFQDAYKAAKAAQQVASPKLSEISTAMNGLRQAMAALKPSAEAKEEALIQELEEMILEAAGYTDTSKYTKEHLEDLEKASADAQKILGKAGIQRLTAAKSALANAIRALKSEDQEREQKKEQQEAQTELRKAIDETAAYSDASKFEAKAWKEYQTALAEAKRIQGDSAATKEQILAAKAKLQAALQKLKENPYDPNFPEDGKIVTDQEGVYRYRVTSVKNKTVEVIGFTPAHKSDKKIKINHVVKLSGADYKVTAVAANAFKGSKKAVSVAGGKNLVKIGSNAFAGCKSLKKATVSSVKLSQIGGKAFCNCKALRSIVIKSKSLKSVGKNALKGIHKKAVIKVPKAKYKKYVKLLAKKGQAKTVKIKK